MKEIKSIRKNRKEEPKTQERISKRKLSQSHNTSHQSLAINQASQKYSSHKIHQLLTTSSGAHQLWGPLARSIQAKRSTSSQLQAERVKPKNYQLKSHQTLLCFNFRSKCLLKKSTSKPNKSTSAVTRNGSDYHDSIVHFSS